MRDDELMAAWRVITPALERIDSGKIPMHTYRYGWVLARKPLPDFRGEYLSLACSVQMLCVGLDTEGRIMFVPG